MKHEKISTPSLIAHRGYSSRYPENTLCAFRKAFECGSCYVECDVQLTQDKVPVVVHDNELSRTSDVSVKVHELRYAELQKFSAGFARKFGDKFKSEKIPLLEDFVRLLKQWPDRRAFVEIKRSSIREFGIDEVLQKVLPELENVKGQVIVISFEDEVIRRLVEEGRWETGWVIDQWSEDLIKKADKISPDYLFVDADCIPADFRQFRQSSWDWVVYEVDDPALARQWVDRGAGFIETNDIEHLLACEFFQKSGCA